MQKPKALKVDPLFCDRFYEVFLDSHLGPSEFVNKIGLSSYTYLNEIKKHVLEPSKSALINTCKEFNVSSDWLLFGIGTKYRKGTEVTLQQDVTSLQRQIKKLTDKVIEACNGVQDLKNLQVRK